MAASFINFSGIASGIDSNSLIKALLDRERFARVRPLQDSISDLEDRNTALSDLTGLLNKLKTSADKFRELNGSVLAKSAASTDETVLTGSASSSATNGTYSVTVTQLAKNATQSFNDRFSSSDSIINSSINNGVAEANRTVTVTTGTGGDAETVNVVLDNTTTLSQFVDEFNAASSKTEAAVVNVGTSAAPSYAVVFNSSNEGLSKGQLAFSVGSEIQTAGAGAFSASTLSQATDATLTVSGINGTITRSTNSIADVIPGLTLDLAATGTATISIADDADTTAASMQDFVDSYNEIVKFLAVNDQVTREEDGENVSNIFAPLAKETLDESLASSLREALTSSGISSGSVRILADLGITTERDGTLGFAVDTFKDALSSDPQSLRSITQNLGENLSAVNGTIAQYTRFGGLIDSVEQSNQERISSLGDRLGQIEQSLGRQEQSLTAQYARLESLIGQLNSQQGALASLLK